MSALLEYSMFHEVLFPNLQTDEQDRESSDLYLRKVIRFTPEPKQGISQSRLVVFDFETTGLDSQSDRLIELGAIAIEGGVVKDEFSTLIDPQLQLSKQIINITGITQDMLEGQPLEETVITEFLEFIQGSILVAHNADFDMGFLRAAASRLGIDLQLPAFCTLKMARDLLTKLDKRDLDSLADHYDLTFESRHRSIGDVKVTIAVMKNILANEGAHLKTWQDMTPYRS